MNLWQKIYKRIQRHLNSIGEMKMSAREIIIVKAIIRELEQEEKESERKKDNKS